MMILICKTGHWAPARNWSAQGGNIVPGVFAYPLRVTVNGVSSPAMIDSVPSGPLVIPVQH
jgi:hypothetical protein